MPGNNHKVFTKLFVNRTNAKKEDTLKNTESTKLFVNKTNANKKDENKNKVTRKITRMIDNTKDLRHDHIKSIVDIVITINIHERPGFLMKQIKNIGDHIKAPHAIMLSCNDFMFNALKDYNLPDHVHINPVIINKNRFHGSLTNGIVSNMRRLLELYKFKYCIILGSGTLFYNPIDVVTLNNLQPVWKSAEERETNTNIGSTVYQGWHWPCFLNTQLARYYLNNKKQLYSGFHEGMTFSKNVCANIVRFLDEHQDIQRNLFAFEHCVEEFSLQTISTNEVDWTNKEYGYIILGRMCYIEAKPSDNTKWVYKTHRD